MFKRKSKAREPGGIPRQQRYQEDLRNILQLADYEKGRGAKLAFLDFAIRTIGRTLQAETVTDFVCANKSDSDTVNQYWIPFVAVKSHEKRVDLSPYHVISRPWKKGKLCSAVYSVFRWGFDQDEGNYTGTLYRELGLVVVGDGRHHLTAAQLMGSAAADLQIVELTPYFETLTTDGEKWFYEGRESPVWDYRIALLYELARQRAMLSTQQLFPEPERKPSLIIEELVELLPAKVHKFLIDVTSDRQYLNQENRILLSHIERLVKRLQTLGVTDDILIEHPITDILPTPRNK